MRRGMFAVAIMQEFTNVPSVSLCSALLLCYEGIHFRLLSPARAPSAALQTCMRGSKTPLSCFHATLFDLRSFLLFSRRSTHFYSRDTFPTETKKFDSSDRLRVSICFLSFPPFLLCQIGCIFCYFDVLREACRREVSSAVDW